MKPWHVPALCVLSTVSPVLAQPSSPPAVGATPPPATSSLAPPVPSGASLDPAPAAPAPSAPHALKAPPITTGSEGCQDTWPADRARPLLVEKFPKRGLSGHVALLELEIQHLPGEVVFPAGLTFSPDAPEVTALAAADFAIPAPESPVQPAIVAAKQASAAAPLASSGQTVTTRVTLPLVPLPEEAGRHELTLPSLPIAVARASGQVHTVCTDPHVLLVEDPLSSTPNPEKQPDPAPRVQLEVWTSLRDVVLTLAWAVPAALLCAWLFFKFGGKLKRTPPPPPPIPPWQTAREQLMVLRARKLLEASRFEEQLDEICDILRRYLGARYGFDGLECTTRELLRALSARAPDFPEEQAVRTILQRADLVKFARRAPSLEECEDALSSTERIIERTRPMPSLDPRAADASKGGSP